jgi:hypothetical protein
VNPHLPCAAWLLLRACACPFETMCARVSCTSRPVQGEWREFFDNWKPTVATVKAHMKALKPVSAVKALEHEAVLHFNTRHRIRRALLHQVGH